MTAMAAAMASGDGAADQRPVCLLVGASGTLGTAFLQRHRDRYRIAAVHRRRPLWVTTQSQRYVDPLAPGADLQENRNPVFAIRADLTRPGELDRVVDVTLARFGGIDLVVNAAVHYAFGPMVAGHRLEASAVEQFRVNSVLPLQLALAVVRKAWQNRDQENRGRNRSIVNLSSTSGLFVYPGGQSVYAATKAAVIMMTRHMAREFATFGVRANCLAPNSFPQVIPTAQVADAVVRLAEGDMTGKTLVVDTGVDDLI